MSSLLNSVTRWVGLRNYTHTCFRIRQSPIASSSRLIFTVASTALQILYAMVHRRVAQSPHFAAVGLIRAVNLLPWAMPAIVIATAAQWLFKSQRTACSTT